MKRRRVTNILSSAPSQPQPEKKWYKKSKYIVPIIVAVVGGLFALFPIYFPPDDELVKADSKEFELLLIDKNTLKPLVIKTVDAKIKVYCQSPPLILPITLGSAKFSSAEFSSDRPVFLEFDNLPEYALVDRQQLLRPGKNEIYAYSLRKYAVVGEADKKSAIESSEKTGKIAGIVVEENDRPVEGVKISFAGNEPVNSDSLGNFKMSINASEALIKVQAVKPGYKLWTEYIQVNKLNIIINLEKNEK